MNPFLEPTVATPQPHDWHRPSDCKHRQTAQSPKAGVCSPGRSRRHSSAARPSRPRKPGRGVGMALSLAIFAGSMLMPGLAGAINVNAATSEQLQTVKGIGPKMASVIIEERERGGQFESITDLSERVKGIGPKKAAAFQEAGLTVGVAAAPQTPAATSGRRGR